MKARVYLPFIFTNALIGSIVASTIFFYIFLNPFHNWDIDAFLYLGGRLDQGQLLYVGDFETKLPIVQYIFWVPYIYGGIGAWRIASIILVGFALLQPLLSLRKIFNLPKSFLLLLFLASLFVFCNVPGAESAQISIVASALIFSSIINASLGLMRGGNRFYCILSGLMFGFAVSIRPNFLFTAISIFLPLLLPSIRKSILASRYILIVLAALIAILIQFSPYIFSAVSFENLAAGLNAIRSYSNGLNISDLLLSQFTNNIGLVGYVSSGSIYFFILALSIFPTVIFIQNKKSDKTLLNRDLSKQEFSILFCYIVSLSSLLLLEFSFLGTHYWDHYQAMFLPYLTIFSLIVCFIFVNYVSMLRLTKLGNLYVTLLLIGLFTYFQMIYTRYYEIYNIITRHGFVNFNINDRNMDPRLLEFLGDYLRQGKSFYVYDNMNYHRILTHERIGDGHLVLANDVLSGKKFPPIKGIGFIENSSSENTCDIFKYSNKDLIVFRRSVVFPFNLPAEKCLSASNSYRNLCKEDFSAHPFCSISSLYEFYVKR